ncbi:hypothetical protein IQ254_03875 [Nodosilinea sp. LEGE 07088]|uniref:hypothetical protein n=1 Tax=Nodosilinea sp. LEGE 07088 TaxID=2777968 RepID=UPI00187E1FE8|nr:hypothetical protein [Nodosilinea sp. LEGE 07088]MBE9136348.1 hypothetical protein [Nodosilinea sp. LEGE 07088]
MTARLLYHGYAILSLLMSAAAAAGLTAGAAVSGNLFTTTAPANCDYHGRDAATAISMIIIANC